MGGASQITRLQAPVQKPGVGGGDGAAGASTQVMRSRRVSAPNSARSHRLDGTQGVTEPTLPMCDESFLTKRSPRPC